MYEMLVGRPPFDGNTIVQIFEAHLYDAPTPPQRHARECPADLSTLVLRLLEKRPQDRPARASDVQSALANILHGRPMELHAGGATMLAETTGNADESQLPVRPVKMADGRGESSGRFASKWVAILLGVVAVLAVVVSAICFLAMK